MRFKFIIIAPALIFEVAVAQSDSSSSIPFQGTTTKLSTASSTPVVLNDPKSTSSGSASASSTSSQISIMDYKSVYEAATVEEEVKVATERFNLTPSQQEVWLTSATERREAERLAHQTIDSKVQNYEKQGAYKGLKSAQDAFYETIIGYLAPGQKQGLETDRVIMEEKRKRLAKIPPPPPVATVTVAPVDSAAIKQAEKEKNKGKKSKKKKTDAAKLP